MNDTNTLKWPDGNTAKLSEFPSVKRAEREIQIKWNKFCDSQKKNNRGFILDHLTLSLLYVVLNIL